MRKRLPGATSRDGPGAGDLGGTGGRQERTALDHTANDEQAGRPAEITGVRISWQGSPGYACGGRVAGW